MKNIYWKDITSTDKVKDCGNHFKVGDQCVFWHGQESIQAQRFLNAKSKK